MEETGERVKDDKERQVHGKRERREERHRSREENARKKKRDRDGNRKREGERDRRQVNLLQLYVVEQSPRAQKFSLPYFVYITDLHKFTILLSNSHLRKKPVKSSNLFITIHLAICHQRLTQVYTDSESEALHITSPIPESRSGGM